jgi:hypothetical protein
VRQTCRRGAPALDSGCGPAIELRVPETLEVALRIIDVHAHAFPDAIASAAVAALAAEGGIAPHYDGTVGGLLAAMESSAVDRAVVAPVATKPSQVKGINDWVAALQDERIVPFGAMHPDFEDPDAEFERMAELGIRGVKLHSQHQGFLPAEPRMSAIYDAAERHGLIVLFHAGGYVVEHVNEPRPEGFVAVLDAHPRMTCILAHMGGYRRWDEAREHLCGRDVYFDTAYVPRNLDDATLLSLARDHGIDRILFGTDGPWTEAAAEVEYLSGMGFTPPELEAILGRNAQRLLG